MTLPKSNPPKKTAINGKIKKIRETADYSDTRTLEFTFEVVF